MPVSQERSQYKFHLALIAGAGLLFAIPAFVNVYLAGHDFFFHVMFSHHFTEQLWQGDLYPRWMQQMNAGFGSPIFFFYAPLPYYITSLLGAFPFMCWRILSFRQITTILHHCAVALLLGTTLNNFSDTQFQRHEIEPSNPASG